MKKDNELNEILNSEIDGIMPDIREKVLAEAVGAKGRPIERTTVGTRLIYRFGAAVLAFAVMVAGVYFFDVPKIINNITETIIPIKPAVAGDNVSDHALQRNYEDILSVLKQISMNNAGDSLNELYMMESADLDLAEGSVNGGTGAVSSQSASSMTARKSMNDGAPTAAQNNGASSDPTFSAYEDASSDTSKTNVQVEGVDEADIVKNDGKYLYILGNSKNTGLPEISIVDIQNPAEMKIVAKILSGSNGTDKYYDYPIEFYIAENKLIVVSSTSVARDDNGKETAESKSSDGGVSAPVVGEETDEEVTLGSSPDYSAPSNQSGTDSSRAVSSTEQKTADKPVAGGDSSSASDRSAYGLLNGNIPVTKVAVYDVTDKTKPVLFREFSQDGEYVSSRLIENSFYLVSNNPVYAAKDNIKKENCIPYTNDSAAEDEFVMLPANCIALPVNVQTAVYSVVSGFDFTSKDSEATTKAVLGGGNNIYANEKHLYVAVSISSFDEKSVRFAKTFDSVMLSVGMDNTEIMRFDIEDGKVIYKNKAPAAGNILNQYSMDEYNGYFRIATTYTNEKTLDTESGVYIYNDAMELVGTLDGLAPTERIYSARFTGERLHLVTFRQTDPLFVIDLSDPSKPQTLGQLKIPGFSNYMHPYADNLMIGIGMEATEDGRATGMKISLFDSTDPQNPKEISKYLIEGNYSSSDVQYNPKALLFSKEKNIIGFPVMIDTTVIENNIASNFGTKSVFIVFGIENNNKIVKRAEIENEKSTSSIYSNLFRGAYVDETLFTISNLSVKASNMSKNFEMISRMEMN